MFLHVGKNTFRLCLYNIMDIISFYFRNSNFFPFFIHYDNLCCLIMET